jgi:hypothetical protein
VWVNNSWASSVRFGRFSSTCRLEGTESIADYRPPMFVVRISAGISAIALLASAWVQETIAHRGEKV